MDAPSVLTTDVGVVLRRARPDDAPALYAAVDATRAGLTRWMGWCSDAYTAEDAQTFIAADVAGWGSDGWGFVITPEHDDNRIIGVCGLNNVNSENCFCNLGYWVHQDWQGRGIATAATRALAAFGLAHTPMVRLEVVVAVGNEASLAVAQRSGAFREGVLRSRLNLHGVTHDAVMHAFVRS